MFYHALICLHLKYAGGNKHFEQSILNSAWGRTSLRVSFSCSCYLISKKPEMWKNLQCEKEATTGREFLFSLTFSFFHICSSATYFGMWLQVTHFLIDLFANWANISYLKNIFMLIVTCVNIFIFKVLNSVCCANNRRFECKLL